MWRRVASNRPDRRAGTRQPDTGRISCTETTAARRRLASKRGGSQRCLVLGADLGGERTGEVRDEGVVRGVDFRVCQGVVRMAVGEGIGHAFGSGRNVLTAKDVEEFDAFEVCGACFADYLQDGLVGDGFSHEEGQVASDAGELGQSLELASWVSTGQQLIQIQFRQEHGVAKIVTTGERGLKGAEFAEADFAAQAEGGRFEIERRTGIPPEAGDRVKAELFEELLKDAFEIVEIVFGRPIVADPEAGRTETGQGDGESD